MSESEVNHLFDVSKEKARWLQYAARRYTTCEYKDIEHDIVRLKTAALEFASAEHAYLEAKKKFEMKPRQRA